MHDAASPRWHDAATHTSIHTPPSLDDYDLPLLLVPPPSPNIAHYSRPFPPRTTSEMAAPERQSTGSDSFSSDAYAYSDSDTSVDDEPLDEYYLSLSRLCTETWSPAALSTPPTSPVAEIERVPAPAPMELSPASRRRHGFYMTRPIANQPPSPKLDSLARRRRAPSSPRLETLEEQAVLLPRPVHGRHQSAAAQPLPPLPACVARPRAATTWPGHARPGSPAPAAWQLASAIFVPPPPPPNTRCHSPAGRHAMLEKSVFEDSDDESEGGLTSFITRLNLRADDKARATRRKFSVEKSLRTKASRFFRDLGGARRSDVSA